MELKEIENLVKLMQKYDLHELEVREGDKKVRLTQAPSSPIMREVSQTPTYPSKTQESEVQKKEPKEKLLEVRSPFVGTFYLASAPGAEPFVTVNKTVRKGDTLCIVEAMKLMNEIEAERDGTIVEILVENEQPIEYNQLLFLMK
ncbi:MAG: acetyl-CoA carboxylase biotin carboxyl carrier protein [Deltaproteobacteria bacterium]|nr:acetyl-CoA carboxylase biotin carboxyl carrier protein [Deltaproteobacteria bacterium]